MVDMVKGRAFVSGSSGNGKSTLVKEMIRKERRLLVWDPLGEYQREFPEMQVVQTLPDLAKAMFQRRSFKIAFVPDWEGDTVRMFNELAKILFKLQGPFQVSEGRRGAPVTLIVEEADTAYPSRAMKADYASIESLARRGRHFGIYIAWVSQRPSQVNRTARGNLDLVAVFYQSDPDDQIAAAKLLGKVSPMEIEALPPYHYFMKKERQLSNSKTRKT